MAPPLSPLAAELRAAAPEKFFAALFAPAPVREAMMALAAFEAATARATLASQVLAGLGRLSFWRDAIGTAADGRTLSHPAADALRAAIVAHRLPASAFDRHLAAREALLTTGTIPDMDGLAAHASDIALPLLDLGCRVLGAGLPPGAQDAAEVLGLAACLREAIGLARAGRLVLPEAECAAAGFGVQSLAEGRNRAGLASVTEAVARQAQARLGMVPPVPRAARPALLGLVAARAVLAALARAGHDPAAASTWQPGTAMRLGMAWAALTGRVQGGAGASSRRSAQ